ncbi:MAG: ribonuclease J [Clostridiales bacterium GWF2_38_85]|nr:MAG: ribonuclease J [Clostridiales bacterium GWF2_38_85]HBL84570.1 ribonuclease J [Clostridiales bacterium]
MDNNKTKKKKKPSSKSKLKLIFLGGLDEIGRNISVLEYENDIMVIDCGISFPDESMLGVDIVIPDTTYLEKNKEKIRGIVLTHGHEDHIGAIPYFLKSINVPIYGTRLTLGILENKLIEHMLDKTTSLNEVVAGQHIKLGCFDIEFITVNHSIPDAVGLCINTPYGNIIHTGDFKIDLTPPQGKTINLSRFAELGTQGVLALLADSTNVERPGFTPSEQIVVSSFEKLFYNCEKRLVITTFSSNVYRVQQIINYSEKNGRKVAITGRSMLNIVKAAVKLGYMKIPEGLLIEPAEMKRYKPSQLTLITTGSQGEPMSALYRMAYGDHSTVSLGKSDLVIMSSSTIPGNEKLISKIVNELLKRGVEVINDSIADVHVSGHACQEELKIIHSLVKPKYFIPVHGDYSFLKKHADLAKSLGMPDGNIFISSIGKVLEFDDQGVRFNGVVQSGQVMVDGYGVGDVGSIVLRDRKHLAEDGLIVVVAAIDLYGKNIMSGPDIISRGFVYVKESEALMEEIRLLASDSLNKQLSKGINDWNILKNTMKDNLASFIYSKTKRKPMILPVIMEV